MSAQPNILLAFYGDDLTGSTDALEFICRSGVKTFLFLETPSVEQLSNYPGMRAFGVAGFTRSLPPHQMELQLLPAFQMMKESGARHVHYKVCSTFDSSPEVGSIGKAIDCGMQIFQNEFVPVLGGMPTLGRYCVYGNLFARMGIGSKGKIYRLDRHPSMSKHPVTPATESDLRLHLAKQTKKKIGLIDVIEMEKKAERWNEAKQYDDEVVLLDALNEGHIKKVGEWLELQVKSEKALFSVGSSGIEMALGKYWNSKNEIHQEQSWPLIRNASPMLVISGSCSPVTSAQIEYARAKGFEEVILNAAKICEDDAIEKSTIENVIQLLQDDKDIIVHTGTKGSGNLPSKMLGKALGTLAKAGITNAGVKRVVVAGGDTSSFAARAMDIEALEMIAPLIPGAPLCRAYAKNKSIDGIEINLKGGQVGAEDYFMVLKNGN